MQKIKLFCLPYAGGSATMYEKWRRSLHPSIELIAVEYAGRGKRFSEPLCPNLEETIDDLCSIIEKEIDETPYCIFGHSMGALVGYELYHRLKEKKLSLPVHMFLSGKGAPHFPHKDRIIHNLSDADFKDELLKLEGTPKEVLTNEDLMEIFLPILRSDFKAIEEYEYFEKEDIMDCNSTVLYGKDEKMPINEISEWQEHTKKKCNFIKFSGGHFFIHDHSEDIVNIINNTLFS